MKQLFILFLLFFTTDSFASGIASNTNSAPCTNNTLETYSGNSNLAADWQPNEIKLRWYNNNTLMDVQSSANTCTYDGILAVPSTAPNRTGYTFAGWTVRPEIDFATTIPVGVGGIERWAIGLYNNGNRCYYQKDTPSALTVECSSDPTYNELQLYEWKVYFSHGDLYGMSLCSNTSGTTFGQTGTPTTETGSWCWCKATGYKITDSNIINGPTNSLYWVFDDYNYGSVYSCQSSCATRCASFTKSYQWFRTALFTPVAQ